MIPIRDVVEEVTRWDPATSSREFVYIDLSSVDRDTKAVSSPSLLSGRDAPSRARQLVREGDVLVSTVRPNLNAVAQVTKELSGATASTGFCVLRPNERLSGRYLFHWVRTPRFVTEMVRLATGASYPAVSDQVVKSSSIPVPPIEEQRRVAAVLDAADALRAKRRRAIAEFNRITQAMFIDLFGDPVLNPNAWPVGKLGTLADKFSDGPFGSNLKSDHYVDSGVRVIRLQNIGVGVFIDDDAAYISDKHFESLRRHTCVPGDVLVGTLGEPNLRACIQPDWLSVALNKADCVQIRVDESRVTREWMCALLNNPATAAKAQGLVRGQTRTRISMGRLRELEVPVPPVHTQRQFDSLIAVVNNERTRYESSLVQLDTLFATLQQRAFRGEL